MVLDFRPQRQPIPADKNLCWNSENDSGIGSGSSNPSDSSTGDEDAASKDMNQIRSCTLSNVFSPNSRKLTRNISCPSIISRPITLSVLPLEATWCNDTLGPDSPVYLRSDPSNESDWESDTESEDVETHYPSRTTKSKVKAAANAKLSDDASATEWDTGLLKNCFCSSKTILKCSFCVELRKTNSHSTHERTVSCLSWFLYAIFYTLVLLFLTQALKCFQLFLPTISELQVSRFVASLLASDRFVLLFSGSHFGTLRDLKSYYFHKLNYC